MGMLTLHSLHPFFCPSFYLQDDLSSRPPPNKILITGKSHLHYYSRHYCSSYCQDLSFSETNHSMEVPQRTSALLLLSLAFLHFPLIHASISDTSFVFNGFDATDMSLSGIATYDSRLIRLTNTSSRLFGHAHYPRPVRMKDATTNLTSSFGATFVFCISPLTSNIGGHGMAFMMSPSLSTSGAFPSQYLGLLNATNDGKPYNHLFAVEFDTVQDLEFGDINDNHVGVNLNSMISNHSAPAAYWPYSGGNKIDINLKGGEDIQAWIQYDGVKQQLNVTIAPAGQPQPKVPLLSVHLDLSEIVQESMYVGFSGSTGIISGIHRLLSWSFSTNGVPQSLDLSKLPSIVPAPPFHKTKRFIIAVTITSILLLFLLCSLAAISWHKWSQREIVEDWELEYGLHRYSYTELKSATRKFHEKELLGVGGFGRVYRGVLPSSGLEVAVKRLSRESDQGEREFIAEMSSTGRLRHRNLVQLLGWSRRKGELILVYDYMPNGSLDKALFGRTGKLLTWEQRYRILQGVAAGMFYLHEGWDKQVLHRDVKASNVLLDAEMNAKLGDFGLARLYEHGKNPNTTRVVGTLGYLAPEFARTGKATTATDVYSFGALLLEVATGKRPLEHTRSEEDLLLVDGVWELYTQGKVLEAVDPRLLGHYDVEEMERVLALGLLCTHPIPSVRPTMGQVVQILGKDASLPPLPPPHFGPPPPPPQEPGPLKHDTTLSFSSSSLRSWSTLDASTHLSAR